MLARLLWRFGISITCVIYHCSKENIYIIIVFTLGYSMQLVPMNSKVMVCEVLTRKRS